MHMSDALLSPAVGGVMTAVSAAVIGYSVKKINRDNLDEKIIPMMGVMGAFVFAAQMINFTIPGTGASGHIGGGILLAAILGPFPALLTLSTVLLIQCLFFADGGLLAFGCNVFNLGVCSMLSYMFLYIPIIKNGMNKKNITIASIISVILGLQTGSFGVVLETFASGVTELPFGVFIMLMQPIHLAIGFMEGIVTAAVLCFVFSMRPEIIISSVERTKIKVPTKRVLLTFLFIAMIIGGGLSMFASTLPDGLEWAMEKVAGTPELERNGAVHDTTGAIVNATAIMPDYDFAQNKDSLFSGTAAAGITGGIIIIMFAGMVGFLIHFFRKRAAK